MYSAAPLRASLSASLFSMSSSGWGFPKSVNMIKSLITGFSSSPKYVLKCCLTRLSRSSCSWVPGRKNAAILLSIADFNLATSSGESGVLSFSIMRPRANSFSISIFLPVSFSKSSSKSYVSAIHKARRFSMISNSLVILASSWGSFWSLSQE